MPPVSSHEGAFRLAPGELHSWCVSLCVSPETYLRLQANLTRGDQARSERFRSERDRQRFVVAHGAARELLGRYLRINPRTVRYTYNAFGKPELGPEFGGRLKFNLSHSSDLALFAFAADSDVGVDLEHIRALPDSLEIARRFFSEAEVDLLEALPHHLRPEAFFRCWTRAEAYWKACGRGLANLDGASGATLPAPHWTFFTLRPAPGYVGAVAVEGRGWSPPWRHRHLSADALA